MFGACYAIKWKYFFLSIKLWIDFLGNNLESFKTVILGAYLTLKILKLNSNIVWKEIKYSLFWFENLSFLVCYGWKLVF